MLTKISFLLFGLIVAAECRRTRYRAHFHAQMNGATFQSLMDLPQTVFLVDPDDIKLTAEQNAILRSQGKTVLAYLSIGEAESFRSYWQSNWTVGSPSFIVRPDAILPEQYVTQFWQPEWQVSVLDYYTTHIAPFNYSGLLIDYMQVYDQFLDARPNAAQEMVDFLKRVVDLAKAKDSQAIIVTQDSAGLYKLSEEYRMLVDGVSLQEVYYHDGKMKKARETREMVDLLNGISKDKKVVMLEEYVEKNRHACDFYKKCSLEGFMCGVFDPALSQGPLECVGPSESGIRIPF
ncbi:hypothetical protein RvY_13229 [Ramazzottius varieornatus]|uniref:Glycoside-hydrolase family GH114 TIM-barrel domain-containing protein n=1 Tax=Ramazzottius varieornatus TaxID=947166 RepID=A0A1D1VM65_RAMVA|nr:hypothetical protein RvY_13229 [Ramazzottius varieornatus]